MREHYKISVYILTDSQGEWWEDCNTKGNTSRWIGATAIPAPAKEFKTSEQAIRFASSRFSRFRIFKMTPPIRPSRTWGQEIVHHSQEPSNA